MSFDTNRRAELFVVPEGPDPKKTEPARKPPTSSVSEAEQIEWHRRHNIAVMRANNTCEPYGSLHDADFWTEFAGPESSAYDARELKTIFTLLGGNLKSASPALVDGRYHRDLGEWRTDGAKISIVEFRAIVDRRIADLALSKLSIWRYIDSRPDNTERWAWEALPLEQRIQKFRDEVAQ
jgi:hypothetical protein